jgi:integrase/recombinase XerD
MPTITDKIQADFAAALRREERSEATITKYMHDLRTFAAFLGEREISKASVIAYKEHLSAHGYAVTSVNSMLAAVNKFLTYSGNSTCKVRFLRVQQRAFEPARKELTRAEYERLLSAAAGDPRLALLLQTICATGIRVSELACFTVEAVRKGEITVQCKNKIRSILVPRKLRKKLLSYAQSKNIDSGIIFRTRSGKALHRTNIWAAMKHLCHSAKVSPDKVFPHNLRKLFARTYYRAEKDIAKLADLLGHSSINTTRIYIRETGEEHLHQIERLGLVP